MTYDVLCFMLYVVHINMEQKIEPITQKVKTKTIAYVRASTDKQDTDHQRLEILEFARQKGYRVDDYIELTMSSRKDPRERRIEELTQRLNAGDTLIVTELSRIGRSTGEVIMLVNKLVEQGVRLIVIKQKLDLQDKQDMTAKIMITLFSLFAELERDLISVRTKEALAAKKAQGKKLGKPIGTVQASIYDKDRDRIEELLRLGVSIRKIQSRHLKYGSPSSLSFYVQKRVNHQAL